MSKRRNGNRRKTKGNGNSHKRITNDRKVEILKSRRLFLGAIGASAVYAGIELSGMGPIARHFPGIERNPIETLEKFRLLPREAQEEALARINP